jgi:hypothetical protein
MENGVSLFSKRKLENELTSFSHRFLPING